MSSYSFTRRRVSTFISLSSWGVPASLPLDLEVEGVLSSVLSSVCLSVNLCAVCSTFVHVIPFTVFILGSLYKYTLDEGQSPTYCEWPRPTSSRSSHACGTLCHSQSRARDNMYIKLIFTAPYHGSDLFRKWVTLKIFFKVILHFFISWHMSFKAHFRTMDQIPFKNGWFFHSQIALFNLYHQGHSMLVVCYAVLNLER